MRKQLPVICVAAGIVLLAACTNDGGQQQTTVAPQPAVCNGPTVEISGAEPRYEPLNPTANRIISVTVKVIKSFRTRPALAGWLAAIYDAEPGSNLTASGDVRSDAAYRRPSDTAYPQLCANHQPANGRMIVVRINDRGPYGTDRVISCPARRRIV